MNILHEQVDRTQKSNSPVRKTGCIVIKMKASYLYYKEKISIVNPVSVTPVNELYYFRLASAQKLMQRNYLNIY